MAKFERIIAIAALTALVSCTTQPFPTGPAVRAPVLESDNHVSQLLRRAERAPPRERRDLLLEAAAELALAGEYAQSESLLTQLPIEQLPVAATDLIPYTHLAIAEALLAERAGDFATATNTAARMEGSLQLLPAPLAAKAGEVQVRLTCLTAAAATCARARVALSERLAPDSEAAHINRESLWRALVRAERPALAELRSSGREPLSGWADLALMYRDSDADLTAELAAVQDWTRLHPAHPASLNLPSDLALLQELVAGMPQQVALLLPFSGRYQAAATALRDGFMAAYYEAMTRGQQVPQVRFYDAANTDINSLYDRALQDGAEVVIGPLEKATIEELALRPGLSVPTLALNHADLPLGPVQNLFQAGLGIEDEARASAERIWSEGHRQVLVLAPEGAAGDRSASAFSTAFTELGGVVAGLYRFGELSAYSTLIKDALLLEGSEMRARQVESVIGPVVYQPRIRQDIDAVFAVANAAQARQLKPTFAFHFAGQLPIYTTSQVFDGQPAPKLDSDMNGIRFAALPWFFETFEARRALAAAGGRDPQLQGLYALGVDSFKLYPRLRQLAANPAAQLAGATGNLKMDAAGYVHRDPIWVEFRRGMPERLADLPAVGAPQ